MTCEFKKQLKISECMVFKQTHTKWVKLLPTEVIERVS